MPELVVGLAEERIRPGPFRSAGGLGKGCEEVPPLVCSWRSTFLSLVAPGCGKTCPAPLIPPPSCSGSHGVATPTPLPVYAPVGSDFRSSWAPGPERRCISSLCTNVRVGDCSWWASTGTLSCPKGFATTPALEDGVGANAGLGIADRGLANGVAKPGPPAPPGVLAAALG